MKFDYAGRAAPLAGWVLDICRALVTPGSAAQMRGCLAALCKEFGGCVKFKNSFAAGPAARAARYHQVAAMATLLFKTGTTFGALAADPAVAARWDAYERAPENEVPERWVRHARAARAWRGRCSTPSEPTLALQSPPNSPLLRRSQVR